MKLLLVDTNLRTKIVTDNNFPFIYNVEQASQIFQFKLTVVLDSPETKAVYFCDQAVFSGH